MRVLLVEDERMLSDAVSQFLRRQHCLVDTSPTGPEGLDCALSGIYDAIILDVMLPGLDGFSILKRRREAKPSAALTYGDIELLEWAGKQAYHTTGQSVKLGAKELALLELLLRNPGQILPRETLIERVWGFDHDAEYNNLEVYIRPRSASRDSPAATLLPPPTSSTPTRSGWIRMERSQSGIATGRSCTPKSRCLRRWRWRWLSLPGGTRDRSAVSISVWSAAPTEAVRGQVPGGQGQRNRYAGQHEQKVSVTTRSRRGHRGAITNSKGQASLKKSYSVLQDNFFQQMRSAGCTDLERGERGSYLK